MNNRFKGKAHIPPIFRWATSTEVGNKTKTWGKGVIAWTDSFSKANNSIIFNPNNIGSKIGFVKGAGKNAYDVLNHELGHYLSSKILNIEVKNITIYPYGGITKLNSVIDIDLTKELIISISGIIMQTIYYFIIYK